MPLIGGCCLQVEVNPTSRRPTALGHSGAEVMAFAIKVREVEKTICLRVHLHVLLVLLLVRYGPDLSCLA